MPRSPSDLNRIGAIVSLLFPIPFLFGMAMVVAAFWQTDADFVFGNVTSIDAVLIDKGPPHSVRGRPRYYPTFRLANGHLLKAESPVVATELPPMDQVVRLRCSTSNPGNCKMPASPDMDPVFYGIAAIWSVLSVAITWAMWGSFFRKAWGRAKPK